MTELIPNDNVYCSIVDGTTFLTGLYDLEGTINIQASGVHLDPGNAKIIITSIAPLTTVLTKDGEAVGGWLTNQGSKVTLTLKDGKSLTTEYKSLISSPYPTYQFTVPDRRQVEVRCRFQNGLGYKVSSEVVETTATSYIIQQSLKITSILPFDLSRITNLAIAFGSTPPRSEAKRPLMMAPGSSFSLQATQSIEETSVPISLGPLDHLKSMSSQSLSLPSTTELKIQRVWCTYVVGQDYCQNMIALTPVNQNVYPSTVYLIGPGGVPQSSFYIPLTLQGSQAISNLGANTGITVKYLGNRRKYTVTFTSVLDRDVTIEISGYRVNSRVVALKARGSSTVADDLILESMVLEE